MVKSYTVTYEVKFEVEVCTLEGKTLEKAISQISIPSGDGTRSPSQYVDYSFKVLKVTDEQGNRVKF